MDTINVGVDYVEPLLLHTYIEWSILYVCGLKWNP